MNILFPDRASIKLTDIEKTEYYENHYKHVYNYLSYINDIDIIDRDTTIVRNKHSTHFVVIIDNKKILFDYSDYDYHFIKNLPDDIDYYFKFHTTDINKQYCLPFPPMSFKNFNQYYDLVDTQYESNDKILYKCRIYAGATERRKLVLNKLKHTSLDIDYSFTDQLKYYKSLKQCKLNIIVPGATNNTLDRSHMQSFALGIPVITTYLPTYLPMFQRFIPNEDYILCKDDYSDLLDIIDKYNNDKEYLNYISNNAKLKFKEYCSPEAVRQYLIDIIK